MTEAQQADLNKESFELLYKKPLSDKEMFEINQNLTGFFDLLLKIDQRQKGGVSNGNDTSREVPQSNQ